MRFSIHLYICFQFRHWEKSFGCPTDHGYSSLSLLILSSVPGKSPRNTELSLCSCPLATRCWRGCKRTCKQKRCYSQRAWELSNSQDLTDYQFSFSLLNNGSNTDIIIEKIVESCERRHHYQLIQRKSGLFWEFSLFIQNPYVRQEDWYLSLLSA